MGLLSKYNGCQSLERDKFQSKHLAGRGLRNGKETDKKSSTAEERRHLKDTIDTHIPDLHHGHGSTDRSSCVELHHFLRTASSYSFGESDGSKQHSSGRGWLDIRFPPCTRGSSPQNWIKRFQTDVTIFDTSRNFADSTCSYCQGW